MIEATALLLCDGAWENPRNGKVHLNGIFTAIRTTRFPAPDRLVIIYGQLTGKPGESGRLSLTCTDGESDELMLQSQGSVVLGPLGNLHLRFAFDQVKFPKPAFYNFRLDCDGRLIAEQQLKVYEAD